jgi:hypothetical protein
MILNLSNDRTTTSISPFVVSPSNHNGSRSTLSEKTKTPTATFTIKTLMHLHPFPRLATRTIEMMATCFSDLRARLRLHLCTNARTLTTLTPINARIETVGAVPPRSLMGVTNYRGRTAPTSAASTASTTPTQREHTAQPIAPRFPIAWMMNCFAKGREVSSVDSPDFPLEIVGWVAKPSAPVGWRRWVSCLYPAYYYALSCVLMVAFLGVHTGPVHALPQTLEPTLKYFPLNWAQTPPIPFDSGQLACDYVKQNYFGTNGPPYSFPWAYAPVSLGNGGLDLEYGDCLIEVAGTDWERLSGQNRLSLPTKFTSTYVEKYPVCPPDYILGLSYVYNAQGAVDRALSKYVCTCTSPLCQKTPNSCPSTPNPVAIGTAWKQNTERVYSSNGALQFTISISGKKRSTKTTRSWWHNYDAALSVSDRATSRSVFVFRSDGAHYLFTKASGVYSTDIDTSDRLTELKDAAGVRTGWTYYESSSENTEQYSAEGLVIY